MSANDDFPRGWPPKVVAATGAGNTASITVPAIIGVQHVIDRVTAKLVNENVNVLSSSSVIISSSDNTFASTLLGQVYASGAAVAGELESDELQLDNVNAQAGANASITVAFASPAGAGVVQVLTIQGHDN